LVEFTNSKLNLYQRFIKITNNKYFLKNCKLQKLTKPVNSKNYLLNLGNFNYLLKLKSKSSKFYIQIARNKQIGTFVTNSFRTLTGGTIYYDSKNYLKFNNRNKNIRYINKNNLANKYKPTICYRTLIWLGEEFH